jgi:hypothetical protein
MQPIAKRIRLSLHFVSPALSQNFIASHFIRKLLIALWRFATEGVVRVAPC